MALPTTFLTHPQFSLTFALDPSGQATLEKEQETKAVASPSNLGNTKCILGTNVTWQRCRALDERAPQSPTDGFAIVCVWRVEAALQTEAAAVDSCNL